MNLRNKNFGTPEHGGRFASRSRFDPMVTVGNDVPDRLTLSELERAQRLHGSYDADSAPDYYPVMDKVFAAARETVAAMPDAQLELTRRRVADEVSEMTGLGPSEVRDIAEQLQDDRVGPPSGEAWNAEVRMLADAFGQASGTIMFIDDKMRAAGRPPKPDRTALQAQKKLIDNQLAALDVTDTAAAVKKRYPSATSFTATTTDTGYDGQQKIAVLTARRLPLAEGDPEDFNGMFDAVELVPDKHAVARSPLRHCTMADDQPHVRHYDLAKMAALTPEDLS